MECSEGGKVRHDLLGGATCSVSESRVSSSFDCSVAERPLES